MTHQIRTSALALAVLTALTAAVTAQAADVRIYGRMDTGLIYNSYGKDSVKDDTFTMESGTNTASRWGIRGSEKLSDDTDVIFRMENRFTSDDGALKQFSGKDYSGRMFGGVSIVGILNKNLGELTFGRVPGPSSGSGPYDLQIYMDAFGGGTNGTGNAPVKSTRYDNVITYRTPMWANVQGTFQYSLKTDGYEESEESMSDSNRFLAAALRYNVGQLNAIVSYEAMFWGNKKQKIDNGADENRQLITIGGSYRFEPVTVYLQAQYFRGANRVDDFRANDQASNIKGYGLYAGTQFWYGLSSWQSMIYWRDYEKEDSTGKSYDGQTIGISTKYLYRPSKTIDMYVGAGFSQWDRIDAGQIKTDQNINVFSGITKYF